MADDSNTESVSLESLYTHEVSSVYSLLSRLGAPKSDLADLVHDTFVTAVKRWHTYDKARPVRPWILGIAWKVMSDFRNKASTQREKTTDELPEPENDGPTLEDHIERKEARAMIDEALQSLDDVKRAVFVMHELEGLSPNDISQNMGCPAQTTYTRLRQARAEFEVAVRRIQRRNESP